MPCLGDVHHKLLAAWAVAVWLHEPKGVVTQLTGSGTGGKGTCGESVGMPAVHIAVESGWAKACQAAVNNSLSGCRHQQAKLCLT